MSKTKDPALLSKHYARYRDTVRKANKAYYDRNKEIVLAKERARRKRRMADPVKREAVRVQKRAYAVKNKARLAQKKREWAAANRALIRAKMNSRRRRDRGEAIEAYGGKCACCGEERFEFLAIDHVDGGGGRHRRSLTAGQRRDFCAHLRKLHYPADFRLLCHNCNQSLGVYGYCPHATCTLNEPLTHSH